MDNGSTADIDLKTIEHKNKDRENASVKHVKSTGYFDVVKFPISTFPNSKVAYAVRGIKPLRVTIKSESDWQSKGSTQAEFSLKE